METIQRTFILGDQWLYYKVYTGFKSADVVLTSFIQPLITHLLEQQIIDQWFFIRYNDPEYHLRIRFRLTQTNYLQAVIGLFHRGIIPFIEQGVVWKLQTDTYQRELERYGQSSIYFAERLFAYDSNMQLRLLARPFMGKNEKQVKDLLALQLIDALLNDLGYSLLQKLDLLKVLKNNFAKEFNFTPQYAKQLSVKYRELKSEIEMLMNPDTESVWQPYLQAINHRSEQIQTDPEIEVLINLDINIKNSLASSYIHMCLNRFFRTSQRVHEMLVYDFLFRYYESLTARLKVL